MSYKPTKGMVEEAKRGLEWRREFGRGGTEVGIARARDIVNGKNLSESTVKRMYSFFSRHEVDKKGKGFDQGEEGYPSNGRIAWALWGGDAGFSWSRNIVESLKDEERMIDEMRPYPNEHAARINDPDKYDYFRRRQDAGGDGIDFIFGIKDNKSEIQSIRFDAEMFSEMEAKEWLDDNNFKPIKFEPATSERDMSEEIKTELDEEVIQEHDKRHIVNIEETEDAYIVTYAKVHTEEENEDIETATYEERYSRSDMERRGYMFDGDKYIDEENRLVRIGVSSEEPVERSFGMEVIDHSLENMNLEFLKSGRAPLLLDHDMTKLIGCVETVELDETARRLRAVVRFGKSELASEVFNDVLDGIRQNISVGYRIDNRVRRENDPEDYFRVATTPMEISIVSIPADQSSQVGVGRATSETLNETTSVKEKPMSEEIKNDIKIDVDAVKAEAVRAARKNDSEILSLAAKHNKRDLGEEAIRNGLSVDQFRGALLDAIGNQPLETPAHVVDAPVKEQRSYSLARMVQAQISGDWRKAGYEREMHDEIAKRTGKEAEGIYVPDFAFRAGALSTAATGAVGTENVTDNFVPTVHRGDLFIEALRARQVMSNLGVTYMSGLTNRVKMPKFSAGANAAFVEELGDVSDQSQTDAGITLQPRTLGSYVDVSRLLMLESVPAIEQVVQNDLLASVADRIEYYAINGSGSSGQPTGLLNASIGNVDISAGTDVDALTWADIVALVKTVETSNGIVNQAARGWLSSPAVKAKLASTARVSGTDSVFLLNEPWNSIYGDRAEFTSNVPTNLDPGDGGNDASALIFGDFSQLMVGLFGAPSILVDPYTGSKSGTVRMSIFQEVDVAVRNTASFAKTDEVSVA